MKAVLVIALTLFPLTTYANVDNKGTDQQLSELMKSTKEVVDPMPVKLKALLTDEITNNGPVKAIEMCRVKSPTMAKALSEKTGWSIKRVSIKNRNPEGKTDKWEEKTMTGFERQLAGNIDAVMEQGEIVTIKNKQYFRYAKGLKTTKECSMCHGKDENITTELKEKLKEIYPDDLAKGYDVNQVRGIISVIRPIN